MNLAATTSDMVSADKRQVLPLLTVESESVRNKMLANLRAALPDEHIDLIDNFSSEQLNEVDVEGVEPMTSAVDMAAPMRKDEISDGGKRDKILKNAPKKDDGFFVVPRSVE